MAQKKDIEELRKQLDSQAEVLSTNGIEIKAFVINAALH